MSMIDIAIVFSTMKHFFEYVGPYDRIVIEKKMFEGHERGRHCYQPL